MKYLLTTVICSVLFSSCVTNKKIQYLQKDDVSVNDAKTDTVLRNYDLPHFEYKVQPEDILSVRFESLTPEELDFFSKRGQNQNMNVGQSAGLLIIGELVDPNGEIPLPVIGKVKVSGLNIFEIEEKLKALASPFIQNPLVKVRLVNFRATIMGEVVREGTYVLSNNRVTLLAVVSGAGGLTEFANRSKIKLIRQQNGQSSVQYINLLDERFLASPNFYVHQNDISVVPPLKQRPLSRYFASNLSLAVSVASIVVLIISLSR